MGIQVCYEHWLRHNLWLFHFFLTLSHQSHCLIMNLNASLYNTFSFSITYPLVIMSFPGKYSSNHISQWWGEILLFLEEEEIFVTLITSELMHLRTVCITVSLSSGALCHLPGEFHLHGNWERAHQAHRGGHDMSEWSDTEWHAAMKSKYKMNHPFAGPTVVHCCNFQHALLKKSRWLGADSFPTPLIILFFPSHILSSGFMKLWA